MGARAAGSGRGSLKDGAGCGVVGREKLPAWKRVEDGSPGEGGRMEPHLSSRRNKDNLLISLGENSKRRGRCGDPVGGEVDLWRKQEMALISLGRRHKWGNWTKGDDPCPA